MPTILLSMRSRICCLDFGTLAVGVVVCVVLALEARNSDLGRRTGGVGFTGCPREPGWHGQRHQVFVVVVVAVNLLAAVPADMDGGVVDTRLFARWLFRCLDFGAVAVGVLVRVGCVVSADVDVDVVDTHRFARFFCLTGPGPGPGDWDFVGGGASAGRFCIIYPIVSPFFVCFLNKLWFKEKCYLPYISSSSKKSACV